MSNPHFTIQRELLTAEELLERVKGALIAAADKEEIKTHVESIDDMVGNVRQLRREIGKLLEE